MLNSSEIEAILIKLGFSKDIVRERKTKFFKDGIEYPIYLKTNNKNTEPVFKNPLVIHSNYEKQKINFLNESDGIYPDWDNYYHSSGLIEFDKRKHKGKKEINYGIPLNVENENALKKLVECLSRSPSVAKPIASEYEDIENAKDKLDRVPETTRDVLIQARKGQGKYRENLMAYWGECSVSDVDLPSFLKASHIKPWRDSDNSERLDRYNGLLLNPILDVAFDQGYISFSDEGKILISSALTGKEKTLSILSEMSLKKVDLEHHRYLEWHRRNVFNKK
jgi:putative restriction endonuclease